MSGLSLSFVTDAEAWVMFDSYTSTVMSFPPVFVELDKIVAEVILTDNTVQNTIKNLIRAEFESKGWKKK
jgi:hypothetical protein